MNKVMGMVVLSVFIFVSVASACTPPCVANPALCDPCKINPESCGGCTGPGCVPVIIETPPTYQRIELETAIVDPTVVTPDQVVFDGTTWVGD